MILSDVVRHLDVDVIIGDDSTEPGPAQWLMSNLPPSARKRITYLRLPVDSGVAHGRNKLVAAAAEAGYEYVVITDDDFTIHSPELVLSMAEAMISMKADIVAPHRCDTHKVGKEPEGCRFPSGSILRVPKHRNPLDGSPANGYVADH
jgi:GT2 family glycosyltransferase